MIKFTTDQAGKVTLLEKLARKVEPTQEQLDKVIAPPKYSRVARMLKPAMELKEFQGEFSETYEVPGFGKDMKPVMITRRRLKTGHAAKPTNLGVKMLDGKSMRFHTDGSLRHAGGVVRGKALRKAMKRAARGRA